MAPASKKIIWKESFAKDESKPCLLLNLVPELRAMIFEVLLLRDAPLAEVVKHRTDTRPEGTGYLLRSLLSDGRAKTVLDTAVMATCHQLHAEAAKILFSRNTFIFFDDAAARKKFSKPRLGYVALVRKAMVHIENPHAGAMRVCEMVKAWPNVKQLTLHVERKVLNSMQRKLERSKDRSALLREATSKFGLVSKLRDAKIPKDLDLLPLMEAAPNERRATDGSIDLYMFAWGLARWHEENPDIPNMATLLQAAQEVLQMIKNKRRRVP